MGNRLIINCLYEKKCFIRGLDKAFFLKYGAFRSIKPKA